MKHLPLKAVMTGLEIIETDEGYELHSPAGEAKYDAWGSRREVNGIPEYFPSSISMKKREPAATGDNKNYKSGFEIAIDAGDAAKAIDEIDKHICNGDAFKKLKNGWSFEKDGTLIINNGQVFITDAKISNAMLSDASIEKAKIGNALASNNGSVSTTCEMKIGINRGTESNINAIIKNAERNAANIHEAIQDSDTVYFIRDCEYIAGNGKNYRFGFAAKIRMGVVLSYLVRHEVPGAREPLETEFQLHDSEHAFNYFNSLYSMLCR